MNQGELESARSCFQETLDLHKDARGRGIALHNLGRLAALKGDLEEARRCYRQALPLRREAGEPRGTAETLQNLGVLAFRCEDFAAAGRLYRRSLRLYRTAGYPHGVAMMLNNLGEVAEKLENLEAAVPLFAHSQRLLQELQSRHTTVPAEALRRLSAHLEAALFSRLLRNAEEGRWEDCLQDLPGVEAPGDTRAHAGGLRETDP